MSQVALDLFIGRFHPLVVHLPIGFIILTILLEVAGRYKKNSVALDSIVKLCYPLSIIVCLIAVASGLLLSNHRIYYPDILETHKWLGIATLLLVSAAWVIKLKYQSLSKVKFIVVSLILMVILGTTGHYGGILTHGENYLNKFAPKFLKKIAGGIEKDKTGVLVVHADSIEIYRDIIHPVLQQKCVACHNSDDTYGDFDASNYRNLFIATDEGTPIVPENISSSELFTRISLPIEDEKFMPPKGDHLSYGELLILKYWIENGADSLARFDYSSLDRELAGLLLRDYNLDYSPKPYYEKIVADSINQELFTNLLEEGYAIKYLGTDNNFLDVRFEQDSITEQKLDLLNDIKDNITFLDLSNSELQDNQVSKISSLAHLTRLDLHDNDITDEGIQYLVQLSHLETLNLYNTKISDDGLKELLGLPSLKNIYVWKSAVTSDKVNTLSADFPGIRIDNGFVFDTLNMPKEIVTE